MKEPTYITVTQAMEIHEQVGYGSIHIATMRQWASKYSFGRKVGGKWYINKVKLENFLTTGVDDGEET